MSGRGKPVLRSPQSFFPEFSRKGGPAQTATHYCAGCGHGVLHKLIGEALDDLGIQDRAVFISPVGCAVFGYYYFNCGNVQAAHGRAPALATGLSRCEPHSVMISYQGDGDLGSIGLNETLQAANRGETMAVFFVNNTVYGMTGGQMAPTTLDGARTTTTPDGRDPAEAGHPLHICELIDTLDAPVFVERVVLSDIAHVRAARRAVRSALEVQRDRKGYAFVEALSPCPTNLRMDAEEVIRFLNEDLAREFPARNFRDRRAHARPVCRPTPTYEIADIERAFGVDNVPDHKIEHDPAVAPRQLKIAGFGGQGVLSLGLILSRTARRAGRFTSWFPSYGPEMRGGTAHCSVVISGLPIGSPVVSRPDVLVAMNRPSVERFLPTLAADGLLVYEQSIVDVSLPQTVRSLAVPARSIATQCGEERAANVAMLGALLEAGAINVPEDAVIAAIREQFATKPTLIEPNLAVLRAGQAWFAAPRRSAPCARRD